LGRGEKDEENKEKIEEKRKGREEDCAVAWL
jgi:hypothetical protein